MSQFFLWCFFPKHIGIFNQKKEHFVVQDEIIFLFNHSDSPYDETCNDGSPADTAGFRSFGVIIYVLAAAAEADQVYCQKKQAQTEAHCTNTC